MMSGEPTHRSGVEETEGSVVEASGELEVACDFMSPCHGIALGLDRRSGLPPTRADSRLHDSMAPVDAQKKLVGMDDRQLPHSFDCLRAILENSPDGVVIIGRNRRITYVNPAAEQLFDRPEQEIAGKAIDLYVQRCEGLDRIAEKLRPGHPIRDQDLQLRRRDGTVICVSVSASLLRLRDGTDMGAVAYLRDVTDRRRTEDDLAHANAQLEHYVDAVSHDLRSPLVSLLGFSRLLREDYAARLDEQGRHFLDRIEQAGRTMESLIHDLLELSRIGRTEADKSLIDPRSVLVSLYAELKPRLDREGTSLELPESPPLLICNRTRLYQLFSNLVGNALDHMGEVEQPRIRVAVRSLRESHQITVSDNGKGIDPAHHDRIFEVFQSIGPRKNGRRGTGIGLAIVKKIVETHGGRVWVDSRPDQGASFHLTLPCR